MELHTNAALIDTDTLNLKIVEWRRKKIVVLGGKHHEGEGLTRQLPELRSTQSMQEHNKTFSFVCSV